MKAFDTTRKMIRSSPRLREPLRKLLTGIAVHRPGKQDDIVIVSCKRAGSTWLMQMIAATPGIRSVNEPGILELSWPKRVSRQAWRAWSSHTFAKSWKFQWEPTNDLLLLL